MQTKAFSKRFLGAALCLLMIFSVCLPFPVSSVVPNVSASAASTKKISSCTISVASSVAYTGKAVSPTVTVKNEKKTLKKGTHYTVKYSSNKNMGTASVTVTGVKKNGYTGSKKLTFKIVPAAPKLSATSTTNSVTLSWASVKGATKYKVYSYNSSTKKYTELKTTTSTKYTIKNLSAGKTYQYAVKAYAVKNKTTYTGIRSSVFSVATAPAKVGSLSQSASTTSSVTLKWAKVSGASGYAVYSYDSANKKYKLIKTTTSTSLKITELKAATSYKYAVRAYRTASSKKYYGSYSSVITAVTTPSQVSGVKSTAVSATSISLSWNKISGATGYEVYSYSPTTKKYAKLATVTGNTAKITKVAAGYNYTLCVAAYMKSGNYTVLGAKSKSISVKTPAGADYLKNFQDIIKSGTFTIKYNIDNDYPVTSVVSGDNSTMITNIEGLEAKIVYRGNKNDCYVLVSDFNMYAVITGEEKDAMKPKNQQELFAPKIKDEYVITQSVAELDGIVYNLYSYPVADGSIVYYFNGGQLKRINSYSKSEGQNVLIINSVSSKVDSSVFELPKAFPFGWVLVPM